MAKKILVALSGGVDSSMTAILLKKMGYEVIGVTLRMFDNSNARYTSLDKGIRDAKIFSYHNNIPLYVIDIKDEFQNLVVNYFIEEYKNGKTPNPCVHCNNIIKWSKFIELADVFNCDYVSTGHYVKTNIFNGRYYISEAADLQKDQSFFLWKLTQKQLSRTIFPLGDKNKEEIKKMASEHGFSSMAKKKESYNVCFIPSGNYRKFINSYIEKNVGDIIFNGEKIGNHNGIWNFTIGQRKGLEIKEKEKLCVLKIDALNNNIVVGNSDRILIDEFKVKDINYQKYSQFDNLSLLAKIYYRGEMIRCTVQKSYEEYIVKLSKKVRALAAGQSVVFFENKDVVAGGVVL